MNPSCSTFSPILDISRVFPFGHFNEYKMVFPLGLVLTDN